MISLSKKVNLFQCKTVTNEQHLSSKSLEGWLGHTNEKSNIPRKSSVGFSVDFAFIVLIRRLFLCFVVLVVRRAPPSISFTQKQHFVSAIDYLISLI